LLFLAIRCSPPVASEICCSTEVPLNLSEESVIMHVKELLIALAASAAVLDSALAANNGGNVNALALNPNLVQTASESNGGVANGQAASATYALCPSHDAR
jgi:hypothetical protein